MKNIALPRIATLIRPDRPGRQIFVLPAEEYGNFTRLECVGGRWLAASDEKTCRSKGGIKCFVRHKPVVGQFLMIDRHIRGTAVHGYLSDETGNKINVYEK